MPPEFTVVVVRTLVSALVAVTAPPGMTAPEGSFTLPVIDAVMVWPARLSAKDRTSRSVTVTREHRDKRFILISIIVWDFPGRRSFAVSGEIWGRFQASFFGSAYYDATGGPS